MSAIKKATLLILAILLCDQVSKFYIKLNFSLYDTIQIFDWFEICFIENNGMAFGVELFSKLFLTIFRLIAIGFLAYYIYLLAKRQYKTGYILTIAAVFAGAFGNLIDCLFFGVIFNESLPGQVATLFPDGGGYAPFFYGKVVDMLYFPIISGSYPSWFPIVGGDNFLFFSPVFNIADSAITVAVFVILLFYRKDFNDSLENKPIEENKETK